MIILVNILGILLVIFVIWFFFGKSSKAVEAVGNEITVLVKGGYKPEKIRIKKNQETKITFLRKDSSSCLEEVVIPDFKIRKYLPLDEEVTVKLKPTKSGEFSIHCGMNMYHGKVIVA